MDSDLGSGLDSSREDSSESVESTLVGGGYHLGDVKHEGSLGVTVSDSNGRLVVHGSFVKVLDSVSLGSDGRGKVDNDHLEEGVSSREPFPHDNLEEGLTLEITLLGGEVNLELLENLGDIILLEVHDSVEDLEDRVEDEL